MHNPHPMPADRDKPETRAEAQADRATLLGAVEAAIDVPTRLERKSIKWFLIALVLFCFGMAGSAVYYFQGQVADTRREMLEMRKENTGLRDQLTSYLVSANVSTTGALDRCTAALREQTETNRAVKEVLSQMLAKRP